MGASREKLVLGIPTYGKSFLVSGSDKRPPGVNHSGAGPAGPITKQGGFLGYQEICKNIKNDGWTSVTKIDPCFSEIFNWCLKQVDDPNGPYAYGQGVWVGYDTPEQAGRKAKYIMDNGLGGAMFWDLSTDDFNVIFSEFLFEKYIFVIFCFFSGSMWAGNISDFECCQ
jgi:chitinase